MQIFFNTHAQDCNSSIITSLSNTGLYPGCQASGGLHKRHRTRPPRMAAKRTNASCSSMSQQQPGHACCSSARGLGLARAEPQQVMYKNQGGPTNWENMQAIPMKRQLMVDNPPAAMHTTPDVWTGQPLGQGRMMSSLKPTHTIAVVLYCCYYNADLLLLLPCPAAWPRKHPLCPPSRQ